MVMSKSTSKVSPAPKPPAASMDWLEPWTQASRTWLELYKTYVGALGALGEAQLALGMSVARVGLKGGSPLGYAAVPLVGEWRLTEPEAEQLVEAVIGLPVQKIGLEPIPLPE
jgi:hypothetical protein